MYVIHDLRKEKSIGEEIFKNSIKYVKILS